MQEKLEKTVSFVHVLGNLTTQTEHKIRWICNNNKNQNKEITVSDEEIDAAGEDTADDEEEDKLELVPIETALILSLSLVILPFPFALFFSKFFVKSLRDDDRGEEFLPVFSGDLCPFMLTSLTISDRFLELISVGEVDEDGGL